jgi:hypothetical protein
MKNSNVKLKAQMREFDFGFYLVNLILTCVDLFRIWISNLGFVIKQGG